MKKVFLTLFLIFAILILMIQYLNSAEKECTDLIDCASSVYGCDATFWKHCSDGQAGYLVCGGQRIDCPVQQD